MTEQTINIEYGDEQRKKQSEVLQYDPKTAMLRKELKAFLASPGHILCFALSFVIFALCLIFTIVKAESVPGLIDGFKTAAGIGELDLTPMFVLELAFFCTSCCTVVIKLISLDGEAAWITRVLPIKTMLVLNTKIMLHFLLVAPAAFIFTLVCGLVLEISYSTVVYLIFSAIIFAKLSAQLELILGLISGKSGLAAASSVTSGILLGLAIALLYAFIFYKSVSMDGYFIAVVVALALINRFFDSIIMTKCVGIYESK